ncbi:hypothetical protein N0V82_009716 [Gnomoniopsis sp. IMI 355080]|nr:hypothetical protein N0V82_009716 [Gnomoniopsis sp. IMI 355080]
MLVRPSSRRRPLAAAALGLLTFVFLLHNNLGPRIWRKPTPWSTSSVFDLPLTVKTEDLGDDHPITTLIRSAQHTFITLLAKQSHTLADASRKYRERRGRHPPPGFDVWFREARKRGTVVIEDFFDRIHHDINPFWGLDPLEIRKMAHRQPQVIRVRRGNASFETDNPDRPPFIQTWASLVSELSEHLPDLDMVVNVMDESRVLVPFEKMKTYMAEEAISRDLFSPDEAISSYTDYAALDLDPFLYEPDWITNDSNRYWNHVRAACPPDSPARSVEALPYFDQPIDDLYPLPPVPYTHEGFVGNFTASQDVCRQPHMRGLHGTFIESVSMSTSHELLPMFGGCKLPQNNEILIPGAMYLTDDPFYEGGRDENLPWGKKKDGAIWRGVASGGRNRKDNWWHLHRHRWVQTMNGTVVRRKEAGDQEAGPTFQLPPPATPYRKIEAVEKKQGSIGEWLDVVADVGFNNLECFPMARDEFGHQTDLGCDHTNNYFRVEETVPMTEQYEHKYLPDVDGHSYSARWRGFLRSSSCPLKATVYAEWHDDRLVPWVHFVPFDSSYQDIWSVLDYFVGGHDDEGEKIAQQSREWAAKVLRRDDMLLYVWRLLLEYARVADPNRARLGFVEDLRPTSSWIGLMSD